MWDATSDEEVVSLVVKEHDEVIVGFDEQRLAVPLKISIRAAIPRALEEGRGVWQLPTAAARDASAEVLQVFEALMKKMEPSDAEEAVN
jgi:hypothetical protein